MRCIVNYHLTCGFRIGESITNNVFEKILHDGGCR